MTYARILPCLATLILVAAAGIATPAHATIPVAEEPLYLERAVPPLNMLVVGKDHKLYYEAYNDASDLNADGAIDVGYKPALEYYGYFNSHVCYTFSAGSNRFEPAAATATKKCSGQWSGDYLNYLTTGRLDALRKVLYGGYRQTDTATDTTLQGAFFPQDAHSWGKEYASTARDGFNIAEYAPLSPPTAGRYHLFAVTTVTNNSAPLFRVMTNSPFRIWNWLSIEGPVAGTRCFNDNRVNPRAVCTATNIQTFTEGVETFFSYPSVTYTTWRRENLGARAMSTTEAQLTATFTANATNARRCNVSTTTTNNVINRNNNPFRGQNGCPNIENFFLSMHAGTFVPTLSGTWRVQAGGGRSVHLAVVDTTTSTTVVNIGRYNAGNGNVEADVTLVAGRTYNFTLRMEVADSNDRDQRIRWRRPLVAGATAITDARVRVQVCPASNAALREDNCKEYPAGAFKPTGVLHDYGESDRMFFGLISGSQANNTEGGVLRRNVSSFSSEVNANTGQFNSGVNGIARSLDKLRMIGGGYQGGTTDNSSSDSNWAWGNGTGNCASQGDRAVNNGECRMWGNPIGEMMFEALRYYAGAAAPHGGYSSGGSTEGQGEDTTLDLPTPAWKNPYATVAAGGLGYVACAKPVMTVVSDINPSYDSNVPGGWSVPTFTLPTTISGFNMAGVGQSIWNAEFGAGARNVFIGESATTDGAPTVKSASSLGTIRGLSPEEPSKEGSYSSSAVAYYGWTKPGEINANSQEKLRTYSVALASPLPKIEFPVNGRTMTFVPFAKTAGGTFGGATRKPTNTIVDFYVEEFVNLPGQDVDATVNGGRPKAVFRINYEDVEQGNDHDMDAIVRYDFNANSDNTVTVELRSEYAAGSAIQHMGYVVSGTTADGVYLEVRDTDTSLAASPAYVLNTPPTRAPGYCTTAGPPADCAGLPLVATRIFTASGAAGDAVQLRDPLWYAAKYGGFKDDNSNGVPDGTLNAEWDEDNNGVPDKYFLVTNALTLKAQLAKAFSDIENDSKPAGGVAASGTRRDSGFLAYVPRYDPDDWTGDLKAHRLNPGGALGAELWAASAKLPAATDRKIFVSVPNGSNFELQPFATSNLGATNAAAEAELGFGVGDLASLYSGATINEAVAFLRGDGSREVAQPGGVFRDRKTKLGDILNSQPAVLDRGSRGYAQLRDNQVPSELTAAASAYPGFVSGTKRTRTPAVFVGANDGMLHAFDGSTHAINGGKELFAIIPNGVLGNMHQLVSPNYVHRYYVDASPELGDAYLNGQWKTVLLSGTGAGGRSLMALDVTNPGAGFGANNFLWEFNDSDLGLTMGRPQIVLMEDDKWYAVFGNGLNSDSHDAYLYLVQLDDVSNVIKIRAAQGDDNDATGLGHNGLGAVTPIDTDYDLRIDTFYAPDYQGRIWKFHGIAGETPYLVYTAKSATGEPQAITGALDVTLHHLGGQMIYFGTGRYLIDEDATVPATPPVETFYGIWDPEDGDTILGPIGRSTLVAQTIDSEIILSGIGNIRTTSENPINWAVKNGWFLDLRVAGAPSGLGERFIGEPAIVLGRIIFTTFTPQGTLCEPGGRNWLYALNAISGANDLPLTDCINCGAISLNPAGGTSPPAVSPPLIADPVQPTPCTGPGCAEQGRDTEDPTPACIPGVDPGCVLPPSGASIQGRTCVVNLGVLLADGLKKFGEVTCGRQSWRQLQ